MFTHDWVSVVGSKNDELKETLETMSTKAEALFVKAGDVKAKVGVTELLPGVKLKKEIETWLQSVEKVQKEVRSVKDSVQSGKYSGRILLKDQVTKITGVIEELMQQNLPNEPTLQDHSSSNLPLVTASLTGQLFEGNLKQILSFLNDDSVSIIGVCGVGGIGKTTLASHVQKSPCQMFKDGRRCGSVYFVTVSHGSTISSLQLKIAKELGLNLEGKDQMNAARVIRESLRRRNCVLILDDLWEYLCSNKVGLPIGLGGFKLLLTSRSSVVCRKMGCQTAQLIHVQCLSDDESWDLFREKLGNVDILSPETVKVIARQVARECRGLPIALEHIAISMRAVDTIAEWRIALIEMRSLKHDVMQDEVLPLLRYSYDRLRNQQLKECFLYCSLFPEDYQFRDKVLILNSFTFLIQQSLNLSKRCNFNKSDPFTSHESSSPSS